MPSDVANIQGGRIPSLDGIRALSIIMVLYAHLDGTQGFPHRSVVFWLGDVGYLGVIIFFVISGFLITSLLMTEQRKTGKISLKNFYLRRVLRIFPAFYVFILVMVVASHFSLLSLNARDLVHSLTYTVNYEVAPTWNVGHLWSLSIEEQFYLIWPLIFLVLSKRHALAVAVIAFLTGPIVRSAMRLMLPAHSPWHGLAIFPAMADNIAIGCIFALIRPWLLGQKWYLSMTASHWLALLPLVIILINRLLGYTLVTFFGSPIMLIAIAILIEASTRHPLSLAGRVLNWRPVVFVGVLSYSIYLWQQPFLNRHSGAMFSAFPLNILFALTAALLSYYLVENLFLKARRRLERKSAMPIAP